MLSFCLFQLLYNGDPVAYSCQRGQAFSTTLQGTERSLVVRYYYHLNYFLPQRNDMFLSSPNSLTTLRQINLTHLLKGVAAKRF